MFCKHFCNIPMITRIHSSKMRTVRCSGRLGGGVSAWEGMSAQRGICQGGGSAQAGVFPPVDRMTRL